MHVRKMIVSKCVWLSQMGEGSEEDHHRMGKKLPRWGNNNNDVMQEQGASDSSTQFQRTNSPPE